jgi:hypothetical protein
MIASGFLMKNLFKIFPIVSPIYGSNLIDLFSWFSQTKEKE